MNEKEINIIDVAFTLLRRRNARMTGEAHRAVLYHLESEMEFRIRM